MKNSYTTIFYGALGKRKKHIVGGGETGNHRTIQLLEKNNINVIKVYKPYPKKNFVGYLVYALQMFFKLLTFTFVLVSNPKVKIVHISGFYLHLIYHEFFLILLSRLFGKRCVYELRGGGVTEAFHKRSIFYRLFFKGAVNCASIVLCQGKSYINFLRTLSKAKIVHYPNYILADFLPGKIQEVRHSESVVHLVYFGRIVQSKNPEFLLDVCSQLKSDNFKFDLEIIGSGEQSYINNLFSQIKKLDLEESVRIKKQLLNGQLQKVLRNKHFFLFPSKEKREGHSNSLTEAMALGIVPICSNVGFNKEIVGNENLVVNDYDVKTYANKIKDLWESGKWNAFSNDVSSRINENYTEKKAEKIIIDSYSFV